MSSIDYEPLSVVRKNLRIKWNRCPIEKEVLKELALRSDLQGWFQAGGHLTLFVCTGSLMYFFWLHQIWLGFAAALFAHGTVGSFFVGVAPHELGHSTVFRKKWLNKFFLYLYSLLGWWDHIDYAASHTHHHRYTMYPEGDRENLFPLNPSLDPGLLLQLFTLNIFSKPGRNFGKGGLISTIFVTVKAAIGVQSIKKNPNQEWLQALHTDQPGEHLKSMWWSRLLLLFHGLVIAMSINTGIWVLPLIFTFFPFIGNWGVYFVGLTQHCGLRDNDPDFRKCARTITLNPLAEFLYWRMNWHIEHHMFAGVPCYNLKKLNEIVADDMPKPRTLIGAWKEMRETWRKQQEDPDYQFDTPVPPQRKNPSIDANDPLATSIGELAPKVLA